MWAFFSWLHWWDGSAPALPLARNVTVTFRPAITATPAFRPQVTASVTFTAL